MSAARKAQQRNVMLMPTAPRELAAPDAEDALVKIIYNQFKHWPAVRMQIEPGDMSQPLTYAAWLAFDTLFNAQGVDAQLDLNIIADTIQAHESVPDSVRTMDKQQLIGYLAGVLKAPIQVKNVDYYVGKVADAAQIVRIHNAGQHIIRMAKEGGDTAALLDSALSAIVEIQPRHEQVKRAGDIIAEYDTLMSDTQSLDTGYSAIDDAGGIQRGKVLLVAGHAGSGKTTVMLSITHNVLKSIESASTDSEQNSPCVVHFSFEMKSRAIMTQLLSMESKIYRRKFLRPVSEMNEQDQQQFRAAQGRIKNWPYLIEDSFTVNTPASIRRRLAIHAAQYDIKLVTIDGLWLMNADKDYRDNLAKKYQDMTWGLMQIAEDFNVPILLMHQYGQGGYQASKPDLNHLAGGMASATNFEQVWLMQRDKQDADKMIIHDAKGREFGVSAAPFELFYHWMSNRYEEYPMGSRP